MSEEERTDGTVEQSEEDDSRFEVKWRKKATTDAGSSTSSALPIVEDTGELKRQLEEAQEQIRSLQDRWQRSAADLSNLRRRHEQDRGDIEKFASMMLVAELLPVLDNFDRALNSIPGNLQMLTWIQGVMLIERHFRALLEQRGVHAIEAQGQPFNPSQHEAIGERDTTEVPPGNVVQVYQAGYTMHGRVIRPALVELARAPEASSTADVVVDPIQTTAGVTETKNVDL